MLITFFVVSGLINTLFRGTTPDPKFVEGQVRSTKISISNMFSTSKLFGGGVQKVEKPIFEIVFVKKDAVELVEEKETET